MRSILNKTLPRAIAQLPRKKSPKAQKKPVRFASNLQFPEQAAVSALPETPKNKPEFQTVTHAAPGTVASLPQKPQKVVRITADGEFHIQVGAYTRHTDAMERLASIRVLTSPGEAGAIQIMGDSRRRGNRGSKKKSNWVPFLAS